MDEETVLLHRKSTKHEHEHSRQKKSRVPSALERLHQFQLKHTGAASNTIHITYDKDASVRLDSDNDSFRSRHHHHHGTQRRSRRITLKLPKSKSSTHEQSSVPSLVDATLAQSNTKSHVNPNRLVLELCHAISDNFYDTAMDICHERFLADNSSQIISFELRDVFLSIIEMEFFDSDDLHTEPIELPCRNDDIPLPANLDTWSHGALEVMPRERRESVLDPFLRDIPISIPNPALNIERSSSLISEPTRIIPRPSSPVPSSHDAPLEQNWSQMTSKLSSSENLDPVPVPHASFSIVQLSSSSPASVKSLSVELLFPSKIPRAIIKGSSEMNYFYNPPKYKKSASMEETYAYKLPQSQSDNSQEVRKSPSRRSSLAPKQASYPNITVRKVYSQK